MVINTEKQSAGQAECNSHVKHIVTYNLFIKVLLKVSPMSALCADMENLDQNTTLSAVQIFPFTYTLSCSL